MTTSAATDVLLERARAWLADDPDDTTRAELEQLIADVAAGGDPADLADRFAGTLEFGTAGLRGALGAGPNRMNRVVVIRAAAGLAAYLHEQGATGPVVVGYDARHRSDDFARDTAEVMTGAGFKVWVLPRPLPDAGAGVRDPRARLRGRGDGHREPQPAAGQRLQGLPRRRQPDRAAGGRRDRGPDRGGGRAGRTSRAAPAGRCSASTSSTATSTPSPSSPQDGPRDLDLVYTPLHGVGGASVLQVLETAGFSAPRVVAQQEQPDPDFPTVPFPNPEEPGAMDLAMALAAEHGADLVVANDPDADRCAAAVPTGHERGWRMLRGDEVGALLAHHLMAPRPHRHLGGLDRLLEPARADGRRRRPAVRRDADRLQVDRPGRGPGLRLRGGARLLRATPST